MRKLIVCLIVLAFAAIPASANMVTDGGFEGLSGPGWVSVAAAGETFGAWTGHPSAGHIWIYNGVDQNPPEGTAQVSLGDNYTAASISQLVSGFTIGETYVASFAVGGYNGDDHLGSVQVYDVVRDAYDLDETFDIVGSFGDDMVYHSFQFNASNTELELHLLNPAGHATGYDDVSIVLIPEPATMCLLGLGGLLLRRRR